jgi:hypothetical protein
MKTGDYCRKELIRRQLTVIKNENKSASLGTCQDFADHLISIVGEKGFLVLYSRSLLLLQAACPLLPHADAEPSLSTWFTHLEIALTGQDINEANDAIFQLLMTLTNILASLIGEDLTVEICRSAWRNTTAKRNSASKETKDDKEKHKEDDHTAPAHASTGAGQITGGRRT